MTWVIRASRVRSSPWMRLDSKKFRCKKWRWKTPLSTCFSLRGLHKYVICRTYHGRSSMTVPINHIFCKSRNEKKMRTGFSCSSYTYALKMITVMCLHDSPLSRMCVYGRVLLRSVEVDKDELMYLGKGAVENDLYRRSKGNFQWHRSPVT